MPREAVATAAAVAVVPWAMAMEAGSGADEAGTAVGNSVESWALAAARVAPMAAGIRGVAVRWEEVVMAAVVTVSPAGRRGVGAGPVAAAVASTLRTRTPAYSACALRHGETRRRRSMRARCRSRRWS